MPYKDIEERRRKGRERYWKRPEHYRSKSYRYRHGSLADYYRQYNRDHPTDRMYSRFLKFAVWWFGPGWWRHEGMRELAIGWFALRQEMRYGQNDQRKWNGDPADLAKRGRDSSDPLGTGPGTPRGKDNPG